MIDTKAQNNRIKRLKKVIEQDIKNMNKEKKVAKKVFTVPEPNEPVYKYIIVNGEVKKAKEEKTSHNKVYFTEVMIEFYGGQIPMATFMYKDTDVQVFDTEQEARTALLEQKIAKIEKSFLRFFL
jgi:hypothetical protein